jgi:hypothetical protein
MLRCIRQQRAEFDRARLEVSSPNVVVTVHSNLQLDLPYQVQEEHDARVSALDETICTLMSKLQAQADDAALSEVVRY